jgi:CheY-like chemotaxis protein
LQCVSGGEIVIKAHLREDRVVIAVTGGPLAGNALPDSEFVREAVALQGGNCYFHLNGEQYQFRIELPHARQIVVLMIDDNEDLVHFFQRFTARTRYRLIHVNQGEIAYAAVRRIRPELIVLDVMLPDIDGWEILTRLHDDPDTRVIPIIVCTVIRQEELALALGAAAYLPKPVRRGELLQAFDRVLAQTA